MHLTTSSLNHNQTTGVESKRFGPGFLIRAKTRTADAPLSLATQCRVPRRSFIMLDRFNGLYKLFPRMNINLEIDMAHMGFNRVV